MKNGNSERTRRRRLFIFERPKDFSSGGVRDVARAEAESRLSLAIESPEILTRLSLAQRETAPYCATPSVVVAARTTISACGALRVFCLLQFTLHTLGAHS